MVSPTRPSPRRKRSKTPQLIALAILAAIALIALASFIRSSVERRAAHSMPNPVPATPEVLSAARDNYNSHCASCHGSGGDGQGDKAGELWTKPTDFRNAARMNRSTDGDLYWVTTKGSWPMPAFEKQLSDLQRWQLIDYIRTFATPTTQPAPQPAR
jgi:mono/diheme cytochrome c family protein